MNSLTSQKLSVIYTLPSKSKVTNEKNENSNTVSEEKLIKTPQKNDESQNLGQITCPLVLLLSVCTGPLDLFSMIYLLFLSVSLW